MLIFCLQIFCFFFSLFDYNVIENTSIKQNNTWDRLLDDYIEHCVNSYFLYITLYKYFNLTPLIIKRKTSSMITIE